MPGATPKARRGATAVERQMAAMRHLLAVALMAAVTSMGCASASTDLPVMRMKSRPVPVAANAALQDAEALEKRGKTSTALTAAFRAIEIDPDFFAAHDWLVGFSERQGAAFNARIRTKYERWLQRHPHSLGLLYGMGSYLYEEGSPEADRYLLGFVRRDQSNPKVYDMLGNDAVSAGNGATASGYLRKAAALDPGNAEYALDYAFALERSRRSGALQDIVRRFPNTDVAAEALYALSAEEKDEAQGVKYLEELWEQFPKQAVSLLDRLKADEDLRGMAMLEGARARITARAGQTRAAYRMLLRCEADFPEATTERKLVATGRIIRKSRARVRADIRAAIDAVGITPPAFDLQEYGSVAKLSLAQLRGKVVLLTFWFPGCEPCAEEFPHLEAAMARIRKEGADVVYVGINIDRGEDSEVLPRMRRDGYSFVSLKGSKAVEEAYAIAGTPANFIIDRSGKIVYRDFMIFDPQDEAMLRRMIEAVL